MRKLWNLWMWQRRRKRLRARKLRSVRTLTDGRRSGGVHARRRLFRRG